MIWRIRDRILDCEQPLIMGVLNVTPDSFSDAGKFFSAEHALRRAEQMRLEGADILDIGAESTRPGAKAVSLQEELDRILPVIEKLMPAFPIPISVDTTKPEVAEECLLRGISIVNDVSALKDSGPRMAKAVKDFGAGIVLMHRRGNPETMQSLADYSNVVGEVFEELQESIRHALTCGIALEQIAVDPGIGFAKTTEQNLEIIRNLEKFQELGRPVLYGPSRKSFIGQLTGRGVRDRQFGTAAAVAAGVMKGVSIFRVHEVGAMRDVIRVMKALVTVTNAREVGGNYVRA